MRQKKSHLRLPNQSSRLIYNLPHPLPINAYSMSKQNKNRKQLKKNCTAQDIQHSHYKRYLYRLKRIIFEKRVLHFEIAMQCQKKIRRGGHTNPSKRPSAVVAHEG